MRTFIIGLVFSLLGSSIYQIGKYAQRHHNFDADGYAAEWGCLQGATYGCSIDPDETRRYSCMDKAVEQYCPDRAKRFKAFLSQSSR